MLYENTWTTRNNVIRGLSLSDPANYRLSIDSDKYGVSSVIGTPRNLVSLLLNLPTKNQYHYEKVLDLAQ